MREEHLSRRRLLEILSLLAILVLAAYLRLANLQDNPGWYTDEATHLNIAHHLLQGRQQYFAIHRSFFLLNPPPLFELALAGALRRGGESMGTLRALTGSLGTLSVALLYGVVRRVRRGKGWLALLAALALAVYPQAVVYSRFGFSYNLLTPLVLLTLLGLWEYLRAEDDAARRRWLILAALSAGSGLASDVWMLTLFPAVLLVAALRRCRDALIGGAILALPFGLYALYMLLTVPDAFLYDLRSTLGAMGAPLEEQLPNLAVNFATLVMQDGWMLGGVAGLFLLRPARLRRLLTAPKTAQWIANHRCALLPARSMCATCAQPRSVYR
jgi:4-amino-4-deoxy-L-arabinose transferase-like glycosyltransferase